MSWGPMSSRVRLPLPLCCCLSFVPLSAWSQVSETPARDSWFARDKALHYGVSAGLAGAGYVGGALLFDAPEARWLPGAGVGGGGVPVGGAGGPVAHGRGGGARRGRGQGTL